MLASMNDTPTPIRRSNHTGRLAALRRFGLRYPFAANRGRGQSIVEFALMLPIFLFMVFGVWNFYSYYSSIDNYQNAAGTLSEWIGRTDCYSPGMGATIQSTLPSNVYVYVVFETIIPGSPTVTGGSSGTAPPTTPPGTGWTAPADTGWTPSSDMCAVGGISSGTSNATQVRVEIWSYQPNFLSQIDNVISPVLVGTAVSQIIGQAASISGGGI